jgi:hypothetical protein
MPSLKLKLDRTFYERLKAVAASNGYSGPEEMALHVLEREVDRLSPAEGETPEEVRRKLEGLGYMG